MHTPLRDALPTALPRLHPLYFRVLTKRHHPVSSPLPAPTYTLGLESPLLLAPSQRLPCVAEGSDSVPLLGCFLCMECELLVSKFQL